MNRLKNTLLFPLVALLVLVFASPVWAQEQTVFVSIDASVLGEAGRAEQEIRIPSDASALDALLAVPDLDLNVEESPYGPYVASINGWSDPMGGWLYSVNGETPEVGAADYTLEDGDHVIWTMSLFFAPAEEKEPDQALEELQNYVVDHQLDSPWHTIALSQAGKNTSGVLSSALKRAETAALSRKWTDKEKSILELASLGQRAELEALSHELLAVENLQQQGNNALIYGLLALHAGPFDDDLPVVSTWAQALIASQNDDGSFSLIPGRPGDVDMTAMALQALAPYRAEYKAVIDEGLAYLSAQQEANGAFANDGVTNTESTAQVLLALTSLGSDPSNDPRFQGEGQDIVAALLAFQRDDGSFAHEKGGPMDPLATEQAHLALVALARQAAGEASLWTFPPMIDEVPVFRDDAALAEWAKEDVLEAHAKGLIAGYPDTTFRPKQALTRAEAIALLARVYHWPDADAKLLAFRDVPKGAWYAETLAGAYHEGYAVGVAADLFAPETTINRQTFAVLLSRAYELPVTQRYYGYDDEALIADWAMHGIQVVSNTQLMVGLGENSFGPLEPINREQAAVILNRLDDQLRFFDARVDEAA